MDPLSQCLDDESARRVSAFSVAAEVQDRIDILAAKANEGMLEPQEAAEYEAIVNAADFIAILKAKAQARLI